MNADANVRRRTIDALRGAAQAHERLAAMGAQDKPAVKEQLAEWEVPTYAEQAAVERKLADQIEALK